MGEKKMPSSKAVLASDLWFTVKWRKNNHMDLPQIACQSSFFCCQKRMFSGVDSIWTKYSLAIPVLCRKIATIFPNWKTKKKKKTTAPAHNELLWSECDNCWDSQQCTGTCSLPTLRNEKDNPYTTSLCYMTHTMLVSSLMKSTTPSTSFCENASCIYSLYLHPLNEWSIAWNWISSRMAWDALPCLLEKPHRPRLLMGDTSDDYSFGLEVTDIYASDSLERGSQSTD